MIIKNKWFVINLITNHYFLDQALSYTEGYYFYNLYNIKSSIYFLLYKIVYKNKDKTVNFVIFYVLIYNY